MTIAVNTTDGFPRINIVASPLTSINSHQPIDEEYYHPGEEGLARNLLDDVGEILEDDVEEVKEAVTAVGDAVDAVDIVGETVDDITDIAMDGVYSQGCRYVSLLQRFG